MHAKININLTVCHNKAGCYLFNVSLDTLLYTLPLKHNQALYLQITPYGLCSNLKYHFEVNTSLSFVQFLGDTFQLSHTMRLSLSIYVDFVLILRIFSRWWFKLIWCLWIKLFGLWVIILWNVGLMGYG